MNVNIHVQVDQGICNVLKTGYKVAKYCAATATDTVFRAMIAGTTQELLINGLFTKDARVLQLAGVSDGIGFALPLGQGVLQNLAVTALSLGVIVCFTQEPSSLLSKDGIQSAALNLVGSMTGDPLSALTKRGIANIGAYYVYRLGYGIAKPVVLGICGLSRTILSTSASLLGRAGGCLFRNCCKVSAE